MVELSGIEPLPPLPVRPQQSEDAQTKDSKQARRPRPRIGGAERDRTAAPLARAPAAKRGRTNKRQQAGSKAQTPNWWS